MDDCPIAKLAALATIDRTALSLIEEALRRGCLPRFAPHDDYDPAAMVDVLLAARRGAPAVTCHPGALRSPVAVSALSRPSPKERRQLIANRLRTTPEQSDRQIALDVGSDHKTVGRVRRELNEAGNSPLAGNQVADICGLPK